MESVHTIRLRDPWKQHQSAEGFVHGRTFHAPTGIEPADTVWIVIESQEIPVQIGCNHIVLGTVERQAAFEITGLLQATNQLEILFPDGKSGGEAAHRGSIRLEIRSARDTEPPSKDEH